MSNLSFARIMYGTNEDARAMSRTSALTRSTSVALPKPLSLVIEELLQKAWAALSPKH